MELDRKKVLKETDINCFMVGWVIRFYHKYIKICWLCPYVAAKHVQFWLKKIVNGFDLNFVQCWSFEKNEIFKIRAKVKIDKLLRPVSFNTV